MVYPWDGRGSPLNDRAVQKQLKEAVREHTVEEAMAVLRANDLGGYTIPASGLYPFQVLYARFFFPFSAWKAGVLAVSEQDTKSLSTSK